MALPCETNAWEGFPRGREMPHAHLIASSRRCPIYASTYGWNHVLLQLPNVTLVQVLLLDLSSLLPGSRQLALSYRLGAWRSKPRGLKDISSRTSQRNLPSSETWLVPTGRCSLGAEADGGGIDAMLGSVAVSKSGPETKRKACSGH